jgi:YHS domain-containing protein
MKRTIFVLLLALVVALSIGCSKKKEEAPQTEDTKMVTRHGGMKGIGMDPVSKESIPPLTGKYSYELDGILYEFTSIENMEAFKADPQKYIEEVKNLGEKTQRGIE